LEIAAKAFELNLDDERDRNLLLRMLADIAFGKRALGRPTGTKRWNSATHFILGFHADLILRKNPKTSFPRLAKQIKALHASTYKDTTELALRTELPIAHKIYRHIRGGGILEH